MVTGAGRLLCLYRPAKLSQEGGNKIKKSLVDILACPRCKGRLQLKVNEESAGEVISGELCCSKCLRCYLIEDGIPRLLQPKPGT